MRHLLFFPLIACSHRAEPFGAVTDEGRDALKSWCGPTFEIASDDPNAAESVRKHPDVLFLECSGEDRYGTVAIDARTNQLLDAVLDSDLSSFDGLVDKLLVPTLTADRKQAFDELRRFVRSKHEPGASREWSEGGAFIKLVFNGLTPEGIGVAFSQPHDQRRPIGAPASK